MMDVVMPELEAVVGKYTGDVSRTVRMASANQTTNIKELADSIKKAKIGSENTASKGQLTASETKLSLAKGAIQMLMKPFHLNPAPPNPSGASSSGGTGPPGAVRNGMRPYVQAAKMLLAQPQMGFSQEEIKDMFGKPSEEVDKELD